MKIAIMTIQSINYGNRLQNYALQEVLRARGCQVDSLRRHAGFGKSLVSSLRTVKRTLGSLRNHSRKVLFSRFDHQISFSHLTVSREYVSPNLSNAYDAFVMGSDQIWNPDFDFNSDLEYLPFIPGAKKLAYAASFGVSQITEERDLIASCLSDISSISVREDAGAAIVEDLIGSHAEVVLDPTMLLSTDEWDAIAQQPDIPAVDGPFMLKYVLGDDTHEETMTRLARERELSVVDLKDKSLPVGPAEFVWLIANASMVCTDSFHASVFSLLFHRPFVIFERQSSDADMSSRFDTICRIFNMEHHRYCKDDFDLVRCENEDWGAFEGRLDSECARSLAWFVSALERAGDVRA